MEDVLVVKVCNAVGVDSGFVWNGVNHLAVKVNTDQDSIVTI